MNNQKIKFTDYTIAPGAKFGYKLLFTDKNGVILKVKSIAIIDTTGHMVGELPINSITPKDVAKMVFRDGCVKAWNMIDPTSSSSATFLLETINSAHEQCKKDPSGWIYNPTTPFLYEAIEQHQLYKEIHYTTKFLAKKEGDLSDATYRKIFKQVLTEECEIEAREKAKDQQNNK